MQLKKESSINLLTGKASFTNEPLWYRLVVMIIMALFILGIVYMLHQWALPTLAAQGLSGMNLNNLFKFGIGKSP